MVLLIGLSIKGLKLIGCSITGWSVAFYHTAAFEKECKVRGVSYEVIPDGEFLRIRELIADPETNQEAIKLEKAPKIAVYTLITTKRQSNSALG